MTMPTKTADSVPIFVRDLLYRGKKVGDEFGFISGSVGLHIFYHRYNDLKDANTEQMEAWSHMLAGMAWRREYIIIRDMAKKAKLGITLIQVENTHKYHGEDTL